MPVSCFCSGMECSDEPPGLHAQIEQNRISLTARFAGLCTGEGRLFVENPQKREKRTFSSCTRVEKVVKYHIIR